jgi:hypothetical protein
MILKFQACARGSVTGLLPFWHRCILALLSQIYKQVNNSHTEHYQVASIYLSITAMFIVRYDHSY